MLSVYIKEKHSTLDQFTQTGRLYDLQITKSEEVSLQTKLELLNKVVQTIQKDDTKDILFSIQRIPNIQQFFN